jgi:hypothetical protein
MSKFNNSIWSSITFAGNTQYAQQLLQLIADFYNNLRSNGMYLPATTAVPRVPATGAGQQWSIGPVDSNQFGPGAFVMIVSSSDPFNNFCAGVVTATTQSLLTVNVLAARGATVTGNWNVNVLGSIKVAAPGSTRMGQTGQTTAAGVLNTALQIDNMATGSEAIYDDFCGSVTANFNGTTRQMDRWSVHQVANARLRGNAATLYPGQVPQYNLDPTLSAPTVQDWASHPGVIAMEASLAVDRLYMLYGAVAQTQGYGVSNTSALIVDVHVQIPTAYSQQQFCQFAAGLSNGSDITADGLYIVVGRGPGYDPMTMWILQVAAGVSTWTLIGQLKVSTWYTLRLQRTRGTILTSDAKISLGNSTAIVQATNTFAASTIALGLSPFIQMRKMTGTQKRAMLVDYYAYKPGALTR